MNSIVFIKQIKQFYVHSGIDPKTKEMVREGAVQTINPYDEVALECAIQLKEKSGKGKVTVVTLGPEESEQVLKWGIALGADEAIHVLDKDDKIKDPLQVACVLVEAVRNIQYDQLFFGKMALDDEYGLVGAHVAEMAGLPILSAISDIRVSESGKDVTAQRALERGNREEVICSLPAVFTIDTSFGVPRYPTFPGRKRAEKHPVEKMNAQGLIDRSKTDVNAPSLEVRNLAQPKIRPKKILAPDSGLSVAGRMQFIMGGGMGKKGGDKIGGDPDQTAEAIFKFIEENRFLPVSFTADLTS